MMKWIVAVAVAALAMTTSWAQAQEVKVGVNLPYTGIGAEFAQLVDRGMELYRKLNGDKVKPYKITRIKRDVKDPGAATAKIAGQELLTQDNVDILAGWIYSPNAIASAPIVTAGKKLAVIMNAGTAQITNMSPYYVRTSFSMWHAGYALGEASAKLLNAKTAVVGYTDFPPGKDSLAAFKKSFEGVGGKVIDESPMGGAGAVPDFTPFFQRAKDKKPDVFFVFVAAGDHAAAVVKTFAALGMREAGVKLIGPGDITQDTKLQAMGPAAVGLITMHHYHADLDNPENKRFVEAWKKEYGVNSTPDFMAVGGYHGQAAIGVDVASMLLGGLAAGMVLFIVSVGLSITMGLMGFVNLAHGGFAMLGGYTIALAMRRGDVGFLPALAFGFVAIAALSAVCERLL